MYECMCVRECVYERENRERERERKTVCVRVCACVRERKSVRVRVCVRACVWSDAFEKQEHSDKVHCCTVCDSIWIRFRLDIVSLSKSNTLNEPQTQSRPNTNQKDSGFCSPQFRPHSTTLLGIRRLLPLTSDALFSSQ